MKRVIEELDQIIDSAKAKANEQRGKRDDVRGEADKVNSVIEQQNEELTQIYDKKDKRREEYFKQLLEFEEQQEMIDELKMQYAQKRRLTGHVQERQRRID